MRKVRDSGGQEFTVAEPQDLELFIGRLALKLGLWIAGTGLLVSFSMGAYLTALRKDVQDAGRRVDGIERSVSELQHGRLR